MFGGHHHQAHSVGDKLFLVGGLGGGSEGKLQILDTKLNEWSTGPDLPFNAGSVASVVIKSKFIYLFLKKQTLKILLV